MYNPGTQMRIWVLIIYLKKLAVGVSPTAFLSKKKYWKEKKNKQSELKHR
jgi:hypothetical protein